MKHSMKMAALSLGIAALFGTGGVVFAESSSSTSSTETSTNSAPAVVAYPAPATAPVVVAVPVAAAVPVVVNPSVTTKRTSSSSEQGSPLGSSTEQSTSTKTTN